MRYPAADTKIRGLKKEFCVLKRALKESEGRNIFLQYPEILGKLLCLNVYSYNIQKPRTAFSVGAK